MGKLQYIPCVKLSSVEMERVSFPVLSVGFFYHTVKISEQNGKTQITRQIIIMIAHK